MEEKKIESAQEQTNSSEVKDPSDNLTPDHPRFKEVITQNHELKGTVEKLQEQLDNLQTQISVRQEQTDTDTLTREEEQALARIEKALSARGFAKKDDIESDKMARTLDNLSEKYNGSNGLPKFDATEVVTYAKRNGFSNYEKAYRDMHFDALIQIEAKRAKNIPDKSEKPDGGEKGTQSTAFDPSDIAKMSPDEYEKNREKLLSSMKSH